jgi:hypothetical protein
MLLTNSLVPEPSHAPSPEFRLLERELAGLVSRVDERRRTPTGELMR